MTLQMMHRINNVSIQKIFYDIIELIEILQEIKSRKQNWN